MRTIKFNDRELKVKSLKTTIQPLVGINNNLVSRNVGVSRRLSGFDTNAKVVTLNFPFEHQTGNGVSELISDFFYTENVAKLINPRNEDRYFLAKVDGEIELTEEGRLSYYTVKLIIPDGVSHAIDQKRFEIQNDIAQIENKGTYKTPVDINVTFTSDANSIGFVSEDNIVQLGTAISEDEENAIQSTKVMNDDMGAGTKNLWSTNTGRVRWRYDDGDNTSRVEGALTWGATEVYPTNYGPAADKDKPGYWHGPTVTRMLTKPLNDFEAYHRFEFKPNGNSKEKPTCQGLVEINYSDSDNNFIVGFEMKDNANTADKVEFSFFVGDYRMYKGYLPKSVLSFHGGFFGSLMMKKVGNQFTFRLARINGDNWKETWSIQQSWYNETVAMLSAKIINCFMSKWKNDRPMTIKLTHTRITEFATENEALIPKVFYEGDTLFVDGQTNRVYLNGIRDDGYRVIGSSQSFKVDKGLTEIAVISDGKFTGFLEMRERYL